MYKKLKSLCTVEEIKVDIKKLLENSLKDYKLEKRFIDYLLEYDVENTSCMEFIDKLKTGIYNKYLLQEG